MAERGYFFSIPASIERSKPFQNLARALPLDNILTETDSPFLSPEQAPAISIDATGVIGAGVWQRPRNDPTNVVRGVAAIARVKGLPEDVVKLHIRKNFRKLFGL